MGELTFESLLENDFEGSRVEEKERAESEKKKQTRKKKRKSIGLPHCCYCQALPTVPRTPSQNGLASNLIDLEVGGRCF
jgi:hypothetical protein